MHRQDVIRAVAAAITDDTIVVTNIADASFEMCAIADRPRNFYMLGSFGMASSIALGFALSRPERVVAIDGDGALIYNLGTLATIGRYRPRNLVHVVVDNGAHGATGGQPTATSAGCDLAGVARACGIEAVRVADLDRVREALGEALAAGGPRMVLAAVDEPPPDKKPLPPYTGPEIRDRVRRALGVEAP